MCRFQQIGTRLYGEPGKLARGAERGEHRWQTVEDRQRSSRAYARAATLDAGYKHLPAERVNQTEVRRCAPPCAAQKGLQSVAKKAGLENVPWHTLRHHCRSRRYSGLPRGTVYETRSNNLAGTKDRAGHPCLHGPSPTQLVSQVSRPRTYLYFTSTSAPLPSSTITKPIL